MNEEDIKECLGVNENGLIPYYRNNTDNINLSIEKILTKHKLYVAELEAKVYTYEKIIASSNFAPMINVYEIKNLTSTNTKGEEKYE